MPADPWLRHLLTTAVQYARRNIPTDPNHALYPNHRADERVRDLLEEVLHADPSK